MVGLKNPGAKRSCGCRGITQDHISSHLVVEVLLLEGLRRSEEWIAISMPGIVPKP